MTPVSQESGASEAQEQYWDVAGRLAGAQLDLAQAELAMATFRRAHAGEEFLVFRPEDVERFRQSAIRGTDTMKTVNDATKQPEAGPGDRRVRGWPFAVAASRPEPNSPPMEPETVKENDRE